MAVLEQAITRAKASALRVVLPEMEDERIASAADRLVAEGIATPVDLMEISTAQIAALQASRPKMTGAMAEKFLAKPVVRAAAMVAAGEADVLVAGAATPTRRVIEAAAMTIGPAEGVATVSSFFLMVFPDGRELVFADCAVNVAPTVEELSDIARSSEASARALLGRAQVAMLSFSTGTSGAGPSVDLVREAAETTGFVGPLQADAALNPGIAAKKGLGAGDANVLIFPSLDAGNIAYKLAQELGGAQAIGPFLQGFARPVCDLSRGASVDDIVLATAVTCAGA